MNRNQIINKSVDVVSITSEYVVLCNFQNNICSDEGDDKGKHETTFIRMRLKAKSLIKLCQTRKLDSSKLEQKYINLSREMYDTISLYEKNN